MKKVVLFLACALSFVSCDSVRRLQRLYPDEFPIDIYKECVAYCDKKPQENINVDSLCGEWKWENWGGDKMGITLTSDGRYVYTSEWRDCSKVHIEGTYEWLPEQNKLVLHNYYTRKKIRKDRDLRLKFANLPHEEIIVVGCGNNCLQLYRLGGRIMYYMKD